MAESQAQQGKHKKSLEHLTVAKVDSAGREIRTAKRTQGSTGEILDNLSIRRNNESKGL